MITTPPSGQLLHFVARLRCEGATLRPWKRIPVTTRTSKRHGGGWTLTGQGVFFLVKNAGVFWSSSGKNLEKM